MQETNKLNSRNTTSSCWLTSTDKRREENQLDATERFIALIIRPTCFGHLYAHHQELETILVYYRMWCVMPWLLVVGGQMRGSRLCVRNEGSCATESQNFPLPRRIACCPASDRRPPATKALHTTCGNTQE